MTMPASSAAMAARYIDPRLVEISLCAKSMVRVPPGRRSLDEGDKARREGGRIACLRAVALRIGRDVLDEVTPDRALLDLEWGVAVVAALGAGPARDVERGHVRDRDLGRAAASE